MIQWHPIFAQLLRPVVENYYDMQTTVPVGDAPREADFVLLRRTSTTIPPFRGLWRHLTPWNVLEFKGPSVSPRRGDLELLIELGLGIDRRLRTEHDETHQRKRLPEEMSFWYLANRIGVVLKEAKRKLASVEAIAPGLWRSQVLGRMIFLVSTVDLPVEEDTLPLHVIGKEPLETERCVAQLVADHPELQTLYGGWMLSLHNAAWKEAKAMARKTGREETLDLRPAIEYLGLRKVLQQVGEDEVIKSLGLDSIIERVGKKKVIKLISVEDYLSNISAEDRRELKRLLK